MTGYTADEKLRLQQLRELRRRWLKDQELSPREPLGPPQRVWPMERFWNKFLQDQAPWKNVVSDGSPRYHTHNPRRPASYRHIKGRLRSVHQVLVVPRGKIRFNRDLGLAGTLAALSQESWTGSQESRSTYGFGRVMSVCCQV